MFGLAHLVSPLSVEDFISDFWGKRAVYIPGDADKFKDLFGWQDVNSYLNNAANHDQFRLIYEKNPLPQQSFERLNEWLQRGATLAINHVNMIDEVMKQFNHRLGADLNTHINTNLYVSCPSKQGFDCHFDEHCVFVVQTEGQKSWKVFHPTIKYPLHAQRLGDKGKPPESDPYIEATMRPGDVLFIPRGHWHYAVAETPSLHLTVGPASRSGAEFLIWVARQLMQHEEFFRQDFPVAAAASLGGPIDDASLEAHLDEFRTRACDVIQGDALKESLIRYCMSANPVKRSHRLPEDWMLKDRITPETEFRIPSEQKTIIRYDPETQMATIHVRGHLLQLEGIPELLVAPMFERTGVVITGKGLLAVCADIDWDRLRATLLQMYSHGLLELAESDATVTV